MIIRRADIRDVDFLAEAVIEAEKSGSSVLSYSRIFGLSEEEFKGLLPAILSEDITGQELCISGFLIAEENGQAAATVCGWIEGECGMSSGQLKASLLMQYLDAEKLNIAASVNPILEKVHINRKPGSLQLESIYTVPSMRGKGLAAALIDAHLTGHGGRSAEIIVSSDNQQAVKAYTKAGFSITEEKHSEDAELLNYLPHKGKLKLHRQI